MNARRQSGVVGHGIDLVEIARIERMLIDHGEQFLARVFTSHEQGQRVRWDRVGRRDWRRVSPQRKRH